MSSLLIIFVHSQLNQVLKLWGLICSFCCSCLLCFCVFYFLLVLPYSHAHLFSVIVWFQISVAPIKASFVPRVGHRKTGASMISLLNIGWPLNNYTSGCTGGLWIFSIYLYFGLFVSLENIISWNFVFQCTFYVIYINKMLFFILLNCLIEIDCLVIWFTYYNYKEKK